MSRPPLSDKAFLAHVFSPKKNPLPTGLRKRKIESLKGRKVARVNAYNKMATAKQEILTRTGLRDEYLAGRTTFVDARRNLRETAVNLGVVKPLKTRTPKTPINPIRARIEQMVAQHIKRTLRTSGTFVNENTVDEESVYNDDASDDMLTWDSSQIRYAARRGSEYERLDSSGRKHNPFFYH